MLFPTGANSALARQSSIVPVLAVLMVHFIVTQLSHHTSGRRGAGCDFFLMALADLSQSQLF